MYQEVKSSAAATRTDTLGQVTSYSDFKCWENHLASKIYQLWIIHHIIFWVYTALKKFVSVATRKMFKINLMEFDITEEILDLCYNSSSFSS
jgi:hypothetical protein